MEITIAIQTTAVEIVIPVVVAVPVPELNPEISSLIPVPAVALPAVVKSNQADATAAINKCLIL